MSADDRETSETPTARSGSDADVVVVFGTGPVGCWTARTLVAQGATVRAVNRSGVRPALLPDAVTLVRADLSDTARAIAVAQDATVVVQALNPPYHLWHEAFPALQRGALAAAAQHGARYVSIENLYMYDATTPMTEDSAIAPTSRKGALRQRMAEEVGAAHERGEVRTTALRSSDYYGPGVTGSAWGERVFGPLVAGKRAQVTGALDVPHSLAYAEDVGRAAAVLARRDEALGRVWLAPHAPARSQGEMVALAAAAMADEHGAGAGDPRASAMGRLMMRLGGLFIPVARATVEMMDQFTEPFVADGARIEATFGLAPTPLEVGLARTVAWYRARGVPA